MTQIFLDIENTVIDSLFDNNFLNKNCEHIKQFLSINPGKINIFTWGWKNKSEIDLCIVNAIFDKLEIPTENRGTVLVKEDSIDIAIKKGWLFEEDKSRAIEVGMMAEFGISKISCFIEMAFNLSDDAILIDDLVDENEILYGENKTIKLFNPKNLL